MIAEYEKAKIAERYRRGKLFRARAGEVVTGKRPTATAASPAAPPPADTMDLRARGRRGAADLHRPRRGITVREICRRLNADGIPSPTGNPPGDTPRSARSPVPVGRLTDNRNHEPSYDACAGALRCSVLLATRSVMPIDNGQRFSVRPAREVRRCRRASGGACCSGGPSGGGTLRPPPAQRIPTIGLGRGYRRSSGRVRLFFIAETERSVYGGIMRL